MCACQMPKTNSFCWRQFGIFPLTLFQFTIVIFNRTIVLKINRIIFVGKRYQISIHVNKRIIVFLCIRNICLRINTKPSFIKIRRNAQRSPPRTKSPAFKSNWYLFPPRFIFLFFTWAFARLPSCITIMLYTIFKRINYVFICKYFLMNNTHVCIFKKRFMFYTKIIHFS
jgi:hypothetical protein